MNYYDTLIEVADDCPVSAAHVPQARGSRKTKAVVEYELLVEHPYTYSEEDIAFEVHAVLHDIPQAKRPAERERFLRKGHPHLRVSALAKRHGWGIHNNAEGQTTTVAAWSRALGGASTTNGTPAVSPVSPLLSSGVRSVIPQPPPNAAA